MRIYISFELTLDERPFTIYSHLLLYAKSQYSIWRPYNIQILYPQRTTCPKDAISKNNMKSSIQTNPKKRNQHSQVLVSSIDSWHYGFSWPWQSGSSWAILFQIQDRPSKKERLWECQFPSVRYTFTYMI